MPVLSLTNTCEGDPWILPPETLGLKYIFMKISDSFNILQMVKQWLAFLCSGLSFFPEASKKRRCSEVRIREKRNYASWCACVYSNNY